MQVRVNGEAAALESGLSVSALLAHYGVDARKVAVELNRAIVPRSLQDSTTLAEGDALEIVQFIGGG